jgi:hypothetical protein
VLAAVGAFFALRTVGAVASAAGAARRTLGRLGRAPA